MEYFWSFAYKIYAYLFTDLFIFFTLITSDTELVIMMYQDIAIMHCFYSINVRILYSGGGGWFVGISVWLAWLAGWSRPACLMRSLAAADF